jgi:hypothetical protein
VIRIGRLEIGSRTFYCTHGPTSDGIDQLIREALYRDDSSTLKKRPHAQILTVISMLLCARHELTELVRLAQRLNFASIFIAWILTAALPITFLAAGKQLGYVTLCRGQQPRCIGPACERVLGDEEREASRGHPPAWCVLLLRDSSLANTKNDK